MAFAVAIPTRVSAEHRDLAFWMNRALERLAELRAEPSADAVHALRVALRRCRSVATAVEEIDPHPGWQEMRGGPRKMFRAMGELRDAQILEGLIQEHDPGDERFKADLVDSLKKTQSDALEKTLRQAGKFDEKRWSELAKALHARLKNIPVDGEAARCLALERLEEAKELHRRALRTDKAKPWHELRIGLKRFRYTLELLVPSLHERWIEPLKRVQDLLGDVHDLDTLHETAAQFSHETPPELLDEWQNRLAEIREEKLQTYRQMALGEASLWQSWQSGFPRHEWLALSNARIAATRKAMDPKRRRSLAVSRIARRLWSQFRIHGVHPVFQDAEQRRVVEAAVRLSGIRPVRRSKSRTKSARSFLLDAPVPPGWTFAEWERAAWAIRFQRGSEPGGTHKKFSKLAVEQQAAIQLLAGVLRLALAAQRSGVRSGRAIGVEMLPQGILIRVEGVEDTPEVAARFTEAKLLLERSLGRTILIQPARIPSPEGPTGLLPPPAIVSIR